MTMEEMSIRYTPEQWVEHYQEHYIASLTLDTVTRIIKNDMVNIARECVSIGFHLKAVRDRELFREAGYETIWDYAEEQFGLSRSSASRYMIINDIFSVGGNTPQLLEEYRGFRKSQLWEMIHMSQEQLAQVTQEMTVKQLRELRNPQGEADPDVMDTEIIQEELEEAPENAADLELEESVATSQQALLVPKEPDKEQELSIYGLLLREYPEDSLIKTGGCGPHDCFSCHQSGCRIRQEFCHCVEAPLGNPFPCEMLEQVPAIREGLGEGCQFLDHSLAYHRTGDGEAVPCCKDCENLCKHACSRARKAMERLGGQIAERPAEKPERKVAEPEPDKPIQQEPERLSDLEFLRKMLEKENAEFEEFIKVDKVDKLPEEMMRKKKLLVAALAGMLCDLEIDEYLPIQPELPVMKNNDQRKEWLRNYKDWGLWYEDENIGVKYYRYRFENGAELIVDEYVQSNEYVGEWVSPYYHLIGGPEPPKGSYGAGKWTRHERYDRYPNNGAELVEFLKEIQKGGRS